MRSNALHWNGNEHFHASNKSSMQIDQNDGEIRTIQVAEIKDLRLWVKILVF